MGHIQTQEEWEVQMAEKILSYVRNELYLELRYLETSHSRRLCRRRMRRCRALPRTGDICSTPQSRYCVCLRKCTVPKPCLSSHSAALYFLPSVDCREPRQAAVESRL